MKEYKYSSNYDYPLLAELYDKSEAHIDDVTLIDSLIKESEMREASILDLFCGTGRVLIPLANHGHHITGIDIAKSMIQRVSKKINMSKDDIKDRIVLKQQDVLDGYWGENYDVILLAGNSLYELPSVDMQEKVIRFASEALHHGGKIFIECDGYKRNWGESEIGIKRTIFEGNGEGGDYGVFTMEGVRFDQNKNVLHMKRTWFYRSADGSEFYTEYLSSKHPIAAHEIESLLHKYNFKIKKKLGDREGNSYSSDSNRAIFWAEKQ